MRPRYADTLKEMGFTGTVEEFRAALTEIKAESFPDYTFDELTYTRDEAGTYCALVRKRLGAPRLTRSFILRSLVGLRKNKPKPVKATLP
jgi:hypothetical protein